MTSDEIMSLAREAGFSVRGETIRTMHSSGALVGINNELAKFAELATAKERTASIEAQHRLADMQELAAKSGLAHRMAVQAAVAEAVAAEREACAEIAADEDNIVDVTNYYAQLGDAKATANNIEKAIRARGTP